jgi:U6 snRNA-associated Sm-like protein LSm2
MIFFSLFKTLEGKSVLLELKNSLQIRGTLSSVDQYLNLKLDDVEVVDRESFPQLVRRRGGRRGFCRGLFLPHLSAPPPLRALSFP